MLPLQWLRVHCSAMVSNYNNWVPKRAIKNSFNSIVAWARINYQFSRRVPFYFPCSTFSLKWIFLTHNLIEMETILSSCTSRKSCMHSRRRKPLENLKSLLKISEKQKSALSSIEFPTGGLFWWIQSFFSLSVWVSGFADFFLARLSEEKCQVSSKSASDFSLLITSSLAEKPPRSLFIFCHSPLLCPVKNTL